MFKQNDCKNLNMPANSLPRKDSKSYPMQWPVLEFKSGKVQNHSPKIASRSLDDGSDFEPNFNLDMNIFEKKKRMDAIRNQLHTSPHDLESNKNDKHNGPIKIIDEKFIPEYSFKWYTK
ncbi:MAG: hypothetical protein MHPSP_001097 [Paramarteilia canceri]